MPTGRRSRGTSRGAKRFTTWDQPQVNHTRGTSSGITVTDISHPAIAANNEPTGTCRRMVGNWSLTPQLAPSSEEYNIYVGVTLVTIDALVAGNTPDPQTDVTQDWYYWAGWEGGLADLGLSSQTMLFDVHTSRRVREGWRLVLISQNKTQELGSFFHLNMRCLWSMP